MEIDAFIFELPDVPVLPPLPNPSHQGSDDDDEEEIQEKSQQSHRKRRPVSETKVSDPYATEDPSSMLLPVIIAIAAFVPIVFCLCKLWELSLRIIAIVSGSSSLLPAGAYDDGFNNI